MRGPVCFYQQGLRRSKTLFSVAALILLIACTKDTPPAVASNEKVSVVAPSGPTGWIEGRVTARGKLPALKAQPLDKSLHKQCGTSAPDLSIVVAADGALQFAIVSVDDAPHSPLPAGFTPAFIDQKACVYRPPIVATRAGQKIKVKNSDPLLHNVRAMDDRTPIFNVAMPLENLTIEKPLPASSTVVKLHCDVHPWMTAWVVTFPHDLYAATDADGKFRIDNVGVGRHPVKLWHPRLGEKRVDVEVTADAGTTIDLGWELSDTPSP
jgi:plastocyanin